MSSIAFKMTTAAHSMFSSSGRRLVSLSLSCVVLTRDTEVSLLVAGATVADGGCRAREDAACEEVSLKSWSLVDAGSVPADSPFETGLEQSIGCCDILMSAGWRWLGKTIFLMVVA